MKTTDLLLCILTFFLFGCGSMKNTAKTDRKEDTSVLVSDNSQISVKTDAETKTINTGTRERIVTMYGVRMVPFPIKGDTVLIPVSYPQRSETERDIVQQEQSMRLQTSDSTRRSVEIEYKNSLDEKELKISELKESTMIYQVALLIASVIGLLFTVLYILGKIKLRRFGL